MSSDIPIAFVTSNFQTNPFPEKAGPGSEGSTRVGACQAPSSQWMLRTPQTRREELSPCHTPTSQRATVSQRKPAGTDYIHMQKTAEIVLLTTLT